MKIAVYHNLGSGGAKRSLFELCKELRKRHQVDVFTLSTRDDNFADLRPIANRFSEVGFSTLPLFRSPFGRFNQLSRTLDLLRIRSANRIIAEAINQEDYQVALVEPCQYEGSPSVLRYLRIPSVYFCQEPMRRLYEPMPYRPYEGYASNSKGLLDRVDPLPKLYTSLLESNDRENLQQADLILANSQFIQKQIPAIYQREASVSYLGVDVELFNADSEEPENEPYLLSVGSLTPLKGFDFLIRSLGMLPVSLRLPLVLVCNFVVEGELQYLNELAQQQDVELQIKQEVTDEELARLYRQAVLTLYSPVREPFGLVALESMACATTVVAVREGGLSETVLQEITGLLVARREEEFAAAVQALLDDPDRRHQMGQAGRVHVEANWTWQAAAERLEGYLEDAVGAASERVTTEQLEQARSN